MFKRGFCLLFVFLLSFCLCFGFLITCSGVEASAVDTYTKWTVQETLAFYGSDIPFTYSIGGVSQSGTFHALPYNDRVNAITGLNIEQNSVINNSSGSSYDIIMYSTNDFIATPSDSIDIDIPIDLYYTGGFRSFVGCMVGFNNVTAADNAISTHPDNVFGLQRALSANSAADSSLANYYNLGSLAFNDNPNATNGYGNIPCRLLTFDDVDGAVASIRFQGACTFGADYYLYLIVATPYSYGDVSHESPITTAPSVTTAPSGSGDINVNVDLTETNGLLDSILAALRGLADSILDGLKGLFIPDDDFMDQFKIDMEDLAQDHLGGLYQAEQLLVDMFEDFDQVTAKTEIYIPAAHIPLAGADLVLGNWHVPLKVTGLPAILYDGIAFIIDFLALMAFLSMCRRKLEIFLVPESEAIKE